MNKKYLKPLFEGLEVGATEGTETLERDLQTITLGRESVLLKVVGKRGPMPATMATVFETIEPFILGDLFPEKSTGWSEARVVAFLRDHREIITGEGATFFLLGAGYILGIGYERSQFSAVLLHEGEDIPFTAGQRVALLESS
ncbi:MAG: hypothetical protein AAB933_00760 [Patescibacteria group bacterium]